MGTRPPAVPQRAEPGPLRYLATVLVLFLVFLAIYILKRQLLPGAIVFYEGLGIAAATGIGYAGAVLAGSLWARRRKSATAPTPKWVLSQAMPVAVTFLLLSYAFVITLPALLDRSISIFAIGAVAQRGTAGITAQELSGRLLEQYVNGDNMARKRLDEQLRSGNVRESAGRFYITGRGQLVHRLFVIASDALNIDKKFVSPR